jgi:hypothetical protein
MEMFAATAWRGAGLSVNNNSVRSCSGWIQFSAHSMNGLKQFIRGVVLGRIHRHVVE